MAVMDRSGLSSRGTVSTGQRSAAENMSTSLQPTGSSVGSGLFRRPIKTALHQAVLDCRLHQVRLLVAKHNVNVDCKDLHGRTPMMLACMIEEEFGYKMAKIFLSAGAFFEFERRARKDCPELRVHEWTCVHCGSNSEGGRSRH